MARFTRREIEDSYRTHPLRQQTILRRVLEERGSCQGLTELDLAEDPVTGISDQNHMGGLAFTRQLAEKAEISSASRVLDVGCGLGGSARCLAFFYGCRVHGIDLSPERVSDARELTQLVGLDHLVTFDCADAMADPLPDQQFDVLWGQSAWGHFERKSAFLHKWTKALTAQGRFAIEDVCLLRCAGDEAERTLLTSLEDHWTSYLVPLEGEAGWQGLMDECHLATRCLEDFSADLLGHFVALQTGSTRPGAAPVSEFEQHAWRLAIHAAEAGLIGYFRIVAD